MYELNEAQQAAVGHTDGPALVLAGPGSGKTTVIANRTVRLENEVTDPENIMTLCFGKDAALEMQKRYGKLRGSERKQKAVLATVHSICYTIVREALNGGIRLLEGSEQHNVMKKIFEETNGKKQTDVEQLIASVSRQRNISEYGKFVPPQVFRFGDICRMYAEYKEKHGFIDFDDMIFKAAEILGKNGKVRKKYAKKYVQADEGQDLSAKQFEIIKMLCDGDNIFTVADDDQSIYGFRGAAPLCIVNYGKLFPGAQIYKLEENYRSTGNIVKFASEIVKLNSVRCEKNLFTGNVTGEEAEIICFKNGIAQSRFIAEKIKEAPENETFGILYRNNLSAPVVSLTLLKDDIEYSVSGGSEDIEKHFMVVEFTEKLRKSEESKFFMPLPVDVLKKMEREGFIEKSLLKCELTGKQKRTVMNVLEFLHKLAETCRSYDECIEYFKKADEMKKNGSGRVTLSTVHSAKGLEYDNVFIIDVVKDEFPGKGAYSGALLEEERRLFYVAATRARKKLYVTYPEKRCDSFEEESIFIKEVLRK